MTSVAVIPARGGSQGVVGKNLVDIGGRPLIARAVDAARRSGAFDHVYVSTDHAGIAAAARAAGAEVIDRPVEIATAEASSESALVHAMSEIESRLGSAPRVLGFLQATSPFIDEGALAAAVDRVHAGECDVIFSAVAVHEFLWTLDQGGAVGVNHDLRVRPRRQDRRQEYRETGAFYVMRWDGFAEHRHRFFGIVGIQEVDAATAMEIDEPRDVDLARALVGARRAEASLGGRTVSAVVTDFDGVHTDDRVTVDQHGVESVAVSRGDGMGVSRLTAAGLPFLILSKETNPVVRARAEKLRVEVLSGIDDKATALLDWAAARGIDPAEIAYLGNDINDLPAMAVVGLPVAVADARPEVIDAASAVLTSRGGFGAVRELCDLVLRDLPTRTAPNH